jgi:serine/threonine-protein kinase
MAFSCIRGTVTNPIEELHRALAGRYAVERELGRGGMAFVFLARDIRHGRLVALKLLRPELAAAVGLERFLREIQLAARLQHPNILPLLDSGEADGSPYYAMPYVEGESLGDRLAREGQLPIEDALRITREVADALEYAHSHDVLHRDIKPENILLSGEHAVVADFGIARAISSVGEQKLTETGLAIGTPAYMSPEQASADARIDGRSDIYALGCVLYEMLAGQPPFTGPTAQAVLARHTLDPVPPLRTVRKAVAPSLEQAVMKALEKVPADRFATAAQFSEALTIGAGILHVPRRVSRWRVVAVAGATALIAAAAAVSISRSKATATLDPDLIAVAPFDVLATGQEVYREGLVDLVSSSLSGAGPLRTVSPSTVMARWSGRADPTTAAAFGRDVEAGWVIYGRVVGAGQDSVRVSATLLDVGAGNSRDVEVREAAARLDLVADSLSMRLLREVGRTRPVGAVRSAALGLSSAPALKAFLRGEQFYRRKAGDSAMAYYQRVVELDSTFAPAWRRLALVRMWEHGDSDSLVKLYRFRAGALNHGLPLLDSLKIVADSLYQALWEQARNPAWPQHHVRLFATLDEATRRYADDPEAWRQLVEALLYFPPLGTTFERALEAIDRAVAVDSGFVDAYDYATGVALALGQPDVARRYLAASILRRPPSAQTEGLRLAERLLDPRRQPSERERLIAQASAEALGTAYGVLGVWPDSTESAVRIARALVALGGSADDTTNLRLELLYRGRLKETAALSNGGYRLTPFPWFDLALLELVPPESAAARVDRFYEDGRLGLASAALPWWAQRGDTTAIQELLQRLVRRARTGSPAPWDVLQDAARARAYLALAQSDSSEALRRFLPLVDSTSCTGCSYLRWRIDRLTTARLLSAQGRQREALRFVSTTDTRGIPPLPFDVIIALERGRIAEQLDERDAALAAYGFVADVWMHADPELQPYAAEARAALQRLAGRRRRLR